MKVNMAMGITSSGTNSTNCGTNIITNSGINSTNRGTNSTNSSTISTRSGTKIFSTSSGTKCLIITIVGIESKINFGM